MGISFPKGTNQEQLLKTKECKKCLRAVDEKFYEDRELCTICYNEILFEKIHNEIMVKYNKKSDLLSYVLLKNFGHVLLDAMFLNKYDSCLPELNKNQEEEIEVEI